MHTLLFGYMLQIQAALAAKPGEAPWILPLACEQDHLARIAAERHRCLLRQQPGWHWRREPPRVHAESLRRTGLLPAPAVASRGAAAAARR